MNFISWYLPHSDTTQSLAIIQREAHIHNVQAHSLTLMYRGQARTVVHTARMVIFAFKVGTDWMQVQWAQVKKPNIFLLYRPLVHGGCRVKDISNHSGIEIPQILARVSTLSTADDLFSRSILTRPTTTANVYDLEINRSEPSTGSSSCCSRYQTVAILSVCVVSLAVIIGIRSLTLKSKSNPSYAFSRLMHEKTNEELEYVPKSSRLSQKVDSDSEDSEGGGVRLPNPAREEIPVSENRSARADPLGDTASFPATLRGGRRNVGVHWHREHAREVKEHKRHEKMKRMTKDWRSRAVD